MTEQTKSSVQIMHEALELIVDVFSMEVYYLEDILDIAKKALEKADKAENESQQSERELKRYFDGEAIGRKEALQVFLNEFDEMCDEIREQLQKTFAGYKPRVQAVNRVQGMTHKLIESGK